MNPNPTESTVPTIDWNIPDWRDESAYPKAESTGLAQWKWEFLRRREDYRQDWLTSSQETNEENLKEPKQTTEMRKCSEKYGIPWLIDPRIAEPEELWVFPLACPLFDDLAFPGEGFMMDVFGIQMVLLEHEVGVLFDLLRAPIENQLADIEGEFPMDVYEHDGPNGTLVHKNVQSYLLNPSGLKLEELTVSRKPHEPRIMVHPKQPKGATKAIVIFNLAYAFDHQWQFTKTTLQDLQASMSFPKYRENRKAWTKYLRILDAVAQGENFQAIGECLYPKRKGYEPPKTRARREHKIALGTQNDLLFLLQEPIN